ncbi:MAG: GTP-binding protein, partial [Pirellulaceae bacterium]|nr:GTP-binding protein [Pirellulaceae bacterium]
DQLVGQLATARDEAFGLVQKLKSRQRAGATVRAALVGRPNAGKSSLFNALVQTDGAIVSHLPGTTRDYLAAQIELDGVHFELIDTAGIQAAGPPRDLAETPQDESQESQAVERAAELVAQREEDRADIRIVCVEATASSTSRRRHEPDRSLGDTDTLVFTKADLIEGDVAGDRFQASLLVSSVTGEGLDALRHRLRETVVQVQSAPDSAVASTAARCGESLRAAADALGRAHRMAAEGEGEELIAAEIHVALESLGRVAGTVCTEDVLDRVFSRFCIGK